MRKLKRTVFCGYLTHFEPHDEGVRTTLLSVTMGQALHEVRDALKIRRAELPDNMIGQLHTYITARSLNNPDPDAKRVIADTLEDLDEQ